MMKQTKLGCAFAVGLAFMASAALAAGVASITEDGSVDGNTAYQITCSDGDNFRIWNSSGEWWDGSGAQGGQSRNLDEQAQFLCN